MGDCINCRIDLFDHPKMKRVLFASLALLATLIPASAQVYKGLFVKAGVNAAYPNWSNLNLLMQEFNDLRPGLTVQASPGKTFGGLNVSYGNSWKWFYGELDFMSNRNIMNYQGVDTLGNSIKGTLTMINRSLTLSAGVNIVPTKYFRVGIYAGLGVNPLVFKEFPNAKSFGQTMVRAMLMPMNLLGATRNTMDELIYMSSKIGCNMQIGGKYGVTVEPFWVIPFWAVDMNSTRRALNNGFYANYEDDLFKKKTPHFGIRFCAFFGEDPNKD